MTKLKELWQRFSQGVVLAGLINLPVGKLSDSSDPNAYLPALANRLAQIITLIAYPVAFIGILYSVYMLLVNSGNPDALKTTKKNIGYIAIGVFLLVFSAIIFNFVSAVFHR
jgi:hypothetical protein